MSRYHRVLMAPGSIEGLRYSLAKSKKYLEDWGLTVAGRLPEPGCCRHCGASFVVKHNNTGGRIPKFCSAEHQKLFDWASGKDRMRRMRARLAAAKVAP